MNILITGTSKGLGKAVAEYYLEKNNFVIGCSRGNPTIAHKKYYHVELDVSDEDYVEHAVFDLKRQFSKIDVLINNAGIASMNHVISTPFSTARKIMETNFMGTLFMSREVAKIMIEKKFGRIINFSTVALPLSLEGEAIYSASKAAIVSLTKTMAKELGDYGITVNAVGPNPIDTDLIKGVPDEKISDLIDLQSIKRFGEVRDVVNVLDFFISPISNFITGQIIYLGGI